MREYWVKELDDWVCWSLSGGSELGAVDIKVRKSGSRS